jgi:hypothetical protein
MGELAATYSTGERRIQDTQRVQDLPSVKSKKNAIGIAEFCRVSRLSITKANVGDVMLQSETNLVNKAADGPIILAVAFLLGLLVLMSNGM